MLTRIEIDGFKSFENFSLNLRPLTAVVGPNASGKSNLFDAVRFLSLLSQTDIRSAMLDLRGEPEELFRRTPTKTSDTIFFAVEVLVPSMGVDAFGTTYESASQRLRYELRLGIVLDKAGQPRSVAVRHERCLAIPKKDDTAEFLRRADVSYGRRSTPFIETFASQDSIHIRQDGFQKRGRPLTLSLREATRTALSVVNTAEFPHLYALRSYLSSIRFLEINPQAARLPNDRFEERVLKADASNLASVLANLQETTATSDRPDGYLSDIAADLAALIPSVSRIAISRDSNFSFEVCFKDNISFSSRVISDGTLRLLALLTVLNDPQRHGSLCFEEPENGVHQGRIPMLIDFLRRATTSSSYKISNFQVLLNTHSPVVMAELEDREIVVADSVTEIDTNARQRTSRTRMRTGVSSSPELFDPESQLTRAEVDRILRSAVDAA